MIISQRVAYVLVKFERWAGVPDPAPPPAESFSNPPVIHLAKALLPLPFRFPTPTFFHQSCHAYTFSL